MANKNAPLIKLLAGSSILAAVGVFLVVGSNGSAGNSLGLLALAQDGRVDSSKLEPRWATSATGRIEPTSGAVRLSSRSSGQIDKVLVDTNDVVKAGDPLIMLESDDQFDRIEAATAEVEVRVRERDEEKVTGQVLERRNADDKVADTERALFAARQSLNKAYLAWKENGGDESAVVEARNGVSTAKFDLKSARAELDRVLGKDNLPLQDRLESGLAISRADLSLAEAAAERTVIRAPFDGTVLNLFARVGELATPSPNQALLTLGDVETLLVRAEVEERDVAKVRVGQKVVVRADAFPDQEFLGTVTEVASALGSPRITTRGPRRPNDVDVLEVVAELEGRPPLLTGMRVDVFFRLDDKQQSGVSDDVSEN